MPFDEKKFYNDSPLRIGFYEDFSAACIKRAILTSYGHLASLGHELIKVTELPYFDEIFEVTIKLYFNINFTANKAFINKEEEHNSAFSSLLN